MLFLCTRLSQPPSVTRRGEVLLVHSCVSPLGRGLVAGQPEPNTRVHLGPKLVAVCSVQVAGRFPVPLELAVCKNKTCLATGKALARWRSTISRGSVEVVCWSPTGSEGEGRCAGRQCPCVLCCTAGALRSPVLSQLRAGDGWTDRHTAASCGFPQRGAHSCSGWPPALPGPRKSQPLPCCNPPLPVPPQSLPKSHVETRERQTIIPHGVPFMVKLLCYYASEDSIFLHLEHVQGERGQRCLPSVAHPALTYFIVSDRFLPVV